MKNLVALSGVLALLATLALPALGAEEAITKVEIGKNSEFRVNGKPFFPIMSWLQNPKTYGKLAALGINTHAGEGDPAAAKAAGCYVITAFKPEMAKDPYVLAWFYGDEPDMQSKDDKMKPRALPEVVGAKCLEIKAADPTRPVCVTFTGQFLKEDTKYPDDLRTKWYPEYVKNADVVGFDIYPIYGSGFASHLDYVAKGVAELKRLGGARPVYAWIESSKGSKWMTYQKQPDVLPIHTRNEVWQAIIRGATAFGYFTHAWKPAEKSFAPTVDMQTEMKRLNAQVTRLAPAILADPVTAKIEMKLADGLNCHFKATSLDGFTYIFAENIDLGPDAAKARQFDPIAPRGGPATITVPGLKGGTAIEVVDEARNLKAEDGKFVDDFAPLAEHVYKFKP